MAVLIEGERIVPVWCRAVERLLAAPGRTLSNVVLEVARPSEMTAEDYTLVRRVDAALRTNSPGMTVETVASTIFPQGVYRRFDVPEFYDRAIKLISRGHKSNTWGTYAQRMLQRSAPDGTTFNPLETVVEKITAMRTRGRMWKSVLEVGLHDPPMPGNGCELPLYDPAHDRAQYTNMQCLSHLSFKVVDRTRLDLSAMYRSHYYGQRTLGNLVGLSQLLGFVAKESGMERGTLTCLSTHAYLDDALGPMSDVRQLVTLPAI